jgi:hypothetical protein
MPSLVQVTFEDAEVHQVLVCMKRFIRRNELVWVVEARSIQHPELLLFRTFAAESLALAFVSEILAHGINHCFGRHP